MGVAVVACHDYLYSTKDPALVDIDAITCELVQRGAHPRAPPSDGPRDTCARQTLPWFFQEALRGLDDDALDCLGPLEKISIIHTVPFPLGSRDSLHPTEVLKRFDIDVCRIAFTVDACGARESFFGDGVPARILPASARAKPT